MTESELISFFQHLGDEPADALLRPSTPMTMRTDLVRMLERGNEDGRLDNLVPDWNHLPPWADPAGIRTAQEFFYRRGTSIFLGLFGGVLPRGYALGGRSAPASRNRESARKCMQTNTQFLMDVLTPDGLTARGRGMGSIRELRLLHALARAQGDESLPAARSQADLAASVAAYIVAPLHCLDTLGLPASRMERASYLHFWNVIGQLLGLHPRLRFASVEAAADYLAAFERVRHRPEPHSTQAFLAYANELLPEGMGSLPEALLILFQGEARAARLGVFPRRRKIEPPLLDAAAWLRRMSANPAQVSLIAERTARALLDGLRRFHPGPPTSSGFRLPPVLGSAWKVNSTKRLKRKLRRFSSSGPAKKGVSGKPAAAFFENVSDQGNIY